MLPLVVLAAILVQPSPAPAQVELPVARGGAVSEDRWTVEYTPGPLRMHQAADGSRYWYATFTLTNRTGKARQIAPKWELLDAAGRIKPAGQGVPADVTTSILRLLNDPSLEESYSVIGEIADGKELARTGVVIFPAGPESRSLSLFVAGLSSERSSIRDPKTGAAVPLRKTYRIDYRLPGEVGPNSGDMPLAEPAEGQTNPGWIMR